MTSHSDDDVGELPSGFSSPSKELVQRLRRECEDKHSDEEPIKEEIDTFCPWTFDGWSCLNETPAGRVVSIPCPNFVIGFDKTRFAHKECTLNATWFRHPDTQDPWSNYTTCVDISNLELHLTVNRIYIAGYSISTVAVLVSLFIFIYFKCLRCPRVQLHKNLFSALLASNALWLLWHLLVPENSAVVSKNAIPCQILHILCQYFLVSSYLWMFCEGLYLHTLLAVTFLSERRLMPALMAIGWGLPIGLTAAYVSLRSSDEIATRMCWMEECIWLFVMQMPVVISMVLNFGFLVNIVRVLIKKLRNGGHIAPVVSTHVITQKNSAKKAVRATLLLIPLLGLHFLLTPFRPPPQSPFLPPYLAAAAVAASFQGFAVALLFCFLNGEVLSVVKKSWRDQTMRRRTHNSLPPSTYSLETLNCPHAIGMG